jgi:hypothetical protein
MKKTYRIILLVLLAICLSVLAACTFSSGNGGGDTPEPPPREPVVLDTPDDLRVQGGVVTFAWDTLAVSYQVQIDDREDNVNSVEQFNELVSKLSIGQHYIRIKAIAGDGDTDSYWSQSLTVVVDTPPNALEFCKTSTNGIGIYLLSWDGTEMVHPRFEVDIDKFTGSQWVDVETFLVLDYSAQLKHFDVATYRIKVRSIDAGHQYLASAFSDEIYYAVSSGGLLFTYFSGASGAHVFGRVSRTPVCVIPARVTIGYNQYYVTEIAVDAFRFDAALRSLTIPDFIRNIGYGENSFEGVVLHLTHETPLVTDGLFASAKAIFVKDELLDKYKTDLGYCSDKIFAESSLTEDGLHIINNNVAAYYGSSTDVTVPDGINRIYRDTFAGCDWIESITLPFVGAKLTGIAETNFGYIFGGNENVPSSLVSVTITREERIEKEAFANCKYITSVTLPSTVRQIDDYAFYGCEALFSVNIPDGVTKIGKYAFNACDRLYNIFIPNSVTSIGEAALAAGGALNYLTVGADNGVYHSYYNCIIETASNKLIAVCKTSIIPADIRTIGAGAFAGLSEAAINFAGTEQQWNAIIKSGESIPEDVEIVFAK